MTLNTIFMLSFRKHTFTNIPQNSTIVYRATKQHTTVRRPTQVIHIFQMTSAMLFRTQIILVMQQNKF